MKKIWIGKNEHSYVGERLSAYIDRALPEQERARVQAHLESCAACREELESLLWAKRLLRETPTVAVPRAFVVRRADLEGQNAAKRLLITPRRRTLWATQWATALVGLLFVLVIAGDVLTSRSMMLTAQKAPGEAMPVGAAPEVMLVHEYNMVEQEVMPSSTEDGQDAGARTVDKAQVIEAETVTDVPPAPDATQVMVPEKESGGTSAVMAVQTATPAAAAGESLPATAAITPTVETDMVAKPVAAPTDDEQARERPDETWSPQDNVPLPEGVPIPEGTLLAEKAMLNDVPPTEGVELQTAPPHWTWSPRTIWRAAQIGLGIILTTLVVILIVMHKRV